MSKQLSKGKRTLLKILLVFTSILLVISIAAYAYLQSMLNLINRDNPIATISPDDEFFETDEPNGEGEEMNPDDILWPGDSEVRRDKNVINILLIGQDRRPGESRARSDSMMILTMNKRTGTIKLTSLMRDMYVQIPGYSDNRINASYAFGGMKLLDDTIKKNFLIHIDGNIEVDFDGFTQGIDTIGGIEITLNKQEASHLRKKGFSNAKEGKVKMDGKLALAYARIRKVGNDDFGRTERQRKVIMAAVQKVKDSSVPDIMALANKVLPFVTTDLTNDQLMDLAVTALQMDLGNLQQHRIPVDGSYKNAWVRKMLVLVPDLDVNRQKLYEIIFE
jgi:LCP family protein required for cell wall assembly